MQQSSATQSLHLSFWGLRKIVAYSHSSSQCLLVPTVFGTVSSLHHTSFLMIFILVYTEELQGEAVQQVHKDNHRSKDYSASHYDTVLCGPHQWSSVHIDLKKKLQLLIYISFREHKLHIRCVHVLANSQQNKW